MAPKRSLIVRSGIVTSFCLIVALPFVDSTVIVVVIDVAERSIPMAPIEKKKRGVRRILTRRAPFYWGETMHRDWPDSHVAPNWNRPRQVARQIREHFKPESEQEPMLPIYCTHCTVQLLCTQASYPVNKNEKKKKFGGTVSRNFYRNHRPGMDQATTWNF